ncbi:MAG: hypothetical protein FWH17_07915 [Oscillospiraceae bacterium]|nr:hypothetical protein [Oscillospiraceae bacterium]
MKIDSSIVNAYFAEKPISTYSNHWIYHEVEKGAYLFETPPFERIAEIRRCYDQIAKACDSFIFRNESLIEYIFTDAKSIMESANILFTVGLPSVYDALVREHEGEDFIVIDIVNFANYITNGHKVSDLVINFLSHELIHILINARYPYEEMTYLEYLNFIAFHEGFAHLLSYKENISDYQPNESYREKFNSAKSKLINALNATDPAMQEQYRIEANSGSYWDKYAAISSMLYLLRNIDALKQIYNEGWRGYAELIMDYEWK